MPIARQLIEEDFNDHVEDLALFFVENALGRYDFLVNWGRLHNRETAVREWLRTQGEDPRLSAAVVDHVEKLSRRKIPWIAQRRFDKDKLVALQKKERDGVRS